MRKFYSVAMAVLALFYFGTVQAQEVNEKNVQDLIKANAGQLHISPSDAGNASVSSYFTDPSTGMLYTYIQQTWNGIKVYNTIITAAFRDNKLVYTSGKFVNDIATKALQSVPSLTAAQAVTRSSEHLQLPLPSNLQTIEDKMATEKKMILSPAGIARQNITAELFWVTDDALQNVKLAWNVNIDVANSTDWWNVRIDATTGNFIEKDNWTVHEHIAGNTNHRATTDQTVKTGSGVIAPLTNPAEDFLPTAVTNAAYRVVRFPGESPSSGTMGVDNEPWLKAGPGNNATTHGWHYDGTNDYSITRGNNVFAYLDILNTNNASLVNCPDTSTSVIPNLSFTNTPTFTDPPSTTINRKFAVDNLFYWNNLMHDVMYQYGFNEVSGNFQADNLGRGGQGNDFVRAEGQDASGTNNANFSTPADGASGRMQMYLFSPVPGMMVNSPASIAGLYAAVESGFSINNQLINTGPVTAQVIYFNDDAGGATHEGCVPAVNSLIGKIALIMRGNCNFTVKVKNAQDAGAVGVIMINNVPGDPITMGGTDNTITIPAVMISQADGAIIAAQLANNVNVTLSAGVNRDGDLDNGVVCHEFGHGISNRLTGGRLNASCLANAEQGGEGWSDYLALMMVTNWSTAQLTDGNISRPMGTYVLGQGVNGSGIRIYPYTLNMTANPHTYADLINVSTEVHDIGEVWASALWDMTWNIIAQEGTIEPNIYNATSNGGNAVSLRLVMEGMRLQTCRPGFLDARNAILAADSILYNYRHKCAIWNAFARRGMGYSAQQGSSNSATDQVPAFDVPNSVTLAKAATQQVINQGAQVTVNLSASCGCQGANNYTVRDTIPAGFSYVSSTGGTLNGNVVTFSPLNFTPTETKNFTITLQSTAAGCSVDTAINDDRDGTTIGGLTPGAISGIILWTPSNVRSSSGANSWFAANTGSTTDFTLTSTPFTAGNLSVLSFRHYYVMENSVDGGRVEISNDNGTTWTDAGPYIVQNKYNTVMNATSPWGNNEKAFSGVSYGQGSGQFIQTVVDLSPFSGQTIRVRFRMRTSASNASNSSYEGWFVDDILHMNGCGGIVKAGIYNSTGTVVDNTITPVFIKGNAASAVTFTTQPLNASVCEHTSVSFTALANGTPAPTYKWQVSTDGGATFNDIPGQTSSTLTFTATAGMNGYKYRSVADNGLTQATSNAVTLTVNQLVAVTAHPSDASACGGSDASFTVAATGSGTLTYKWQVSTDNGVTFNDIPGQTTATLTLTTANGMNGNQYRNIVTGTCGPVTSNAATLTVKQQTTVTVNSLPSKICTSDSTIALVANPTGGTWSGTGITGNNFVPKGTAPGNYTLTYTYLNGVGCTTAVGTAAKVDDCPERRVLLSANAIILYPNPNNGHFHIKVNSTLYSTLGMKVYAANGAFVWSQELTGLSFGSTADINLPKLAAGVYMVKFHHTDASGTVDKTFKVVIGTH